MEAAAVAAVDHGYGYQCEFVGSVPEELVCKLCKLVARKPLTIDCCGKRFCQACIEAVIKAKKPCPSCGEGEFSSLLIKKDQRQILALQVHCAMKQRGCGWVGQLEQLDTHLDPECQYVDMECPKCDLKVQKRNLAIHLKENCPKREYMCPHCNYTATFEIVSDKHFLECLLYPVRCPNLCGVTCEREFIEDHMQMCILEEVECELSYAGCKERFLRQDQDEHMQQNTMKHMSLMAAASLRISREFEQKLREKDEAMAAMKEEMKEEIKQELQKKDEAMAAMKDEMKQELKKRDDELKAKLEEKDKQIAELQDQVQQQLQEKGDEIKKLAEEIEARFQVKHDESQKLLKEEIETLQTLLAKKDEKIQELNDKVGNLTQEASDNKTKLEQEIKIRCEQDKKIEELTKHLDKVATKVDASEEKVTRIIRKECGNIQEAQMELEEDLHRKTEELQLAKADAEELKTTVKGISKDLKHPMVVTMSNFSKEKQYSDWKSLPMYTHYQGYKFCIGVNANGYGKGKGTHMSVGCAQVKGEFDAILPWPAKVTIKLELLNQHKENRKDHREVTYWFYWTNPITSGYGGVYAFNNESKFISHEELKPNEEKQTEYLKSNCLKFRVTVTAVYYAD